MISPLFRYFSRYLFFLTIVVLIFFFYPIVMFGFVKGVLIGFLTWSVYILSIPAAHGYYIFGPIARFIGTKPWQSEPIMLLSAIIFNIFMAILFRPLYHATFFTRHLFRIISKPNPYWLMIVISSLGTLYYYLVGEEQFRVHYKFHKKIRLFWWWLVSFLSSISHGKILLCCWMTSSKKKKKLDPRIREDDPADALWAMAGRQGVRSKFKKPCICS